MKKKQYIIPEMEIVNIHVCQLMAGSFVGDVVIPDTLDEGVDALSREFEIDPNMVLEEEEDFFDEE